MLKKVKVGGGGVPWISLVLDQILRKSSHEMSGTVLANLDWKDVLVTS